MNMKEIRTNINKELDKVTITTDEDEVEQRFVYLKYQIRKYCFKKLEEIKNSSNDK